MNVLIALIDPAHIAHDLVHQWFESEGRHAWATCPITENGVLRIIGQPAYPNTPGSPAAVAPIVQGLRNHPGHHFWPDSISLIGTSNVDPGALLTPGQVTDSYLLALAVSQNGKLATLDRRLSSKAVVGGKDALLLI